MRTRLTDKDSVSKVLAEMTIEEKLNLVGAYSACHTLAIEDMDIPSLTLMDGATGVNGSQIIFDYITSPEHGQEEQDALYGRNHHFTQLLFAETEELDRASAKDEVTAEFVCALRNIRNRDKQLISFPSGINIGAAFDPELAYLAGTAVGEEMRDSGVDVCLGPNVDIARDPLGGRNYEMYGEDPFLVGKTAVGFIRGIQSAGTAACAKHFLANNQETNRNTKNTHLSERALREIYGRGFAVSVRDGGVRMIMSAYNAINGEFTSYSRRLLTGMVREEWGFEGVMCCDWGACVRDKEKAIDAGMGLIISGPNDMRGCLEAVKEGRLSETTVDDRAARLLSMMVELRETRKNTGGAHPYCQKELLDICVKTITEGAVLLKNDHDLLPLNSGIPTAYFGRRSRETVECGTGSTMVTTALHSNVFEEAQEYSEKVVFEKMEGADVLIYAVAAPSGENVDRKEMDIEQEDRKRLPEVLKKAKARGMKTVVLLNIAGPVDMRNWIDYADSVLCIFIPGCMGGAAAAKMIYGKASPEGRLPVTMPMRYQDSPSYPNFPGEHNDVYYGEGIFVGYRSYQKRELPVMFPFGYGLGYTCFETELLQECFELGEGKDSFEVPVRVKNIGKREGCEVVQVYAGEEHPHVLRPVRELVGFVKVRLKPGEEKRVMVPIQREALAYYDQAKEKWIQPVGKHILFVGTSSENFFGEAALLVEGTNPYSMGPDSTMGEIMGCETAMAVIDEATNGLLSGLSEENKAFLAYVPLSEVLKKMIGVIPDAVMLDRLIQDVYDKLAAI